MPGALVEAKTSLGRGPLPARRRGAPAADQGGGRRAAAEHPDDLKVTPARWSTSSSPKLDWDKGKAVLHLLAALGLDRDDVVPLFFGDDITDEDAFAALAGRGIGILVGDPDDPEVDGRTHARRLSSSTRREVATCWTRWHAMETTPKRAAALVYDGFDPERGGPARGADARPATATSARAARRSGRTRTTSTTPAPTPTASTTARRRSWAGGRSSTRISSTCPNWLVLKLRIEGEDAIRARQRRAARLPPRARHPQRASSCAALRFRDRAGRETTLRSRRFVSMADVHQAGDRVDAHARELVGPAGDRLRDRRARDQPQRRALPAARGPPPRPRLAAHRSGARSSR